MSVPERVPESAGIIWTLQPPKTVRRTQDKDDCQQRSRRSSLIATLTRTPIREATKDDRAPNFRMAPNLWGRCYGFGSGSDMRGT